jgi:hypothetical protein
MDKHAAQVTLEDIGREFPGWYAWVGVSGVLYARRPLTSPPWVVRAETVDQLRDKIREREGKT